jgi:phage host-nuclease inhibitor protein Gam
MTTKRQSKPVITGITDEQYEDALSQYATSDAELQKINATMDLQLTAIRERYADRISTLTDNRERSFDLIQTYALERKDQLFTHRKSIETAHGIIGFRTGTPKLRTLKGFTWPAVANLLKEFLPDHLRVIEEPAKDRLIADRDNPQVAELFPKCGIRVTQDESFFIDLKKEEII